MLPAVFPLAPLLRRRRAMMKVPLKEPPTDRMKGVTSMRTTVPGVAVAGTVM
jgi:hypothetical protein